jgi:hypothetical protein
MLTDATFRDLYNTPLLLTRLVSCKVEVGNGLGDLVAGVDLPPVIYHKRSRTRIRKWQGEV